MVRPSLSSTLFPYTTLFRSNGIFEPIWNRNFVDHVQLTVAETVGVERRGGYYDEIGAFRRSEEHTSELQSHVKLVCRLLLEKKKAKILIDLIQLILDRILIL